MISTEALSDQRQIIESGTKADYPLNSIAYILDLPTIFSDRLNLSFRLVSLSDGAFDRLVPGAVIGQKHNYDRAVIVEKDGEPLLAICRGVDNSEYLDNSRELATVFNLSDQPEQGSVLVGGKPLENSHNPVGGFDITRLLEESPLNEDVLKIAAVDDGLSVEIFSFPLGV